MCQPGRPRPDGRRPERFALLGRFPQGEVARVVLIVLVHVHARAAAHPAEIGVRQLAVFGEGGDAEINGAFAIVCMSGLAQLLDGLHHVGDVLSGFDQPLRGFEAQHLAILAKRLRVLCGILCDWLVQSHGILDDLVVHVGDVHDVVEPVAARPQPAAQEIDKDEAAEIADVRVIVDGRAAGVHPDRIIRQGSERLHFLREGIIEAQRHKLGKFSS